MNIRDSLIVLFLAGQTLDILTWASMDAAHYERNPIVIFLGPLISLGLKLTMMGLVSYLAEHFDTPSMRAILIFGAVIGFYGAYTNVA